MKKTASDTHIKFSHSTADLFLYY